MVLASTGTRMLKETVWLLPGTGIMRMLAEVFQCLQDAVDAANATIMRF
jgi:hypothetical protein